MRRVRRLAALLLALLALCPAAPADGSPEAWAEARFRGCGAFSGAVIITRGSETLLSYAFGYEETNRLRPATVDTCYRIASVTKMVSAIGLMRLYEQGLFDLDAPLADLLPFRVTNPEYPRRPVTARQTLSHTSGFDSVSAYHPNWEALLPGNRYFLPGTAPGTVYAYANMNGGLTGALIEALTGESVETYMQEQVFAPLGVTASYHAGLLPEGTGLSARLDTLGRTTASPAAQRRGAETFDLTADPREHTDITVGRLVISASGLSRIVRMLLNRGRLGGVTVLQRATVRLMERDQAGIRGSSVSASSPYGLGLCRVEDLPGGVWYGHQGMLEGLSADAFYQPDTGLTCVVIANGCRPKRVNGLTRLARRFMAYAVELAGDRPAPAETVSPESWRVENRLTDEDWSMDDLPDMWP